MTDSPQHDLEDLIYEVGHLTIAWAMLERAIDHCVDALHRGWGGSEIEAEIPRTSLDRKLTFLRACMEKLEVGQLFPEANVAIERIEVAADYRHVLIHGIITDPDAFATTGVMRFRAIRRRKKQVLIAEYETTVEQLLALRDHTTKLAVAMGAFAELLLGDFGDEDGPNQSLGKLLKQLS